MVLERLALGSEVPGSALSSFGKAFWNASCATSLPATEETWGGTIPVSWDGAFLDVDVILDPWVAFFANCSVWRV